LNNTYSNSYKLNNYYLNTSIENKRISRLKNTLFYFNSFLNFFIKNKFIDDYIHLNKNINNYLKIRYQNKLLTIINFLNLKNNNIKYKLNTDNYKYSSNLENYKTNINKLNHFIKSTYFKNSLIDFSIRKIEVDKLIFKYFILNLFGLKNFTNLNKKIKKIRFRKGYDMISKEFFNNIYMELKKNIYINFYKKKYLSTDMYKILNNNKINSFFIENKNILQDSLTLKKDKLKKNNNVSLKFKKINQNLYLTSKLISKNIDNNYCNPYVIFSNQYSNKKKSLIYEKKKELNISYSLFFNILRVIEYAELYKTLSILIKKLLNKNNNNIMVNLTKK